MTFDIVPGSCDEEYMMVYVDELMNRACKQCQVSSVF